MGDPADPSAFAQRGDGGYSTIDFGFRADGSLTVVCTVYDRAGRSGPCRRTGGDTRDVGLWLVEGQILCTQFLAMRGGRKQCFEVFRDVAGFRFHRVSGPLCVIDGEVLERR